MTDRAFLDVSASLTGRRWVGPPPEVERMGLAIAQATGLPEITARILAARGVGPDEAEAYLAPTLRALMPDPSSLRDMDRAAALLAGLARRKGRIALFADYDVDGAASAAIMTRWLRGFGVNPTVYVPDRIAEGYGPNTPAMERLAQDHEMILCLDCGVAAHGPVAAARKAGAQVIIADHHLCGETLPEAEAVVNPNRHDDESGLGHLCAGGVAFMLVVAANRALRAEGVQSPDPMPLLDLVALATVADVAPLTGLNRAFVRQGLKVMAGRGNPGLNALSDAARVIGRPNAFHLGWALGPRINAGGRVGDATLGAALLSTEDEAEARRLAAELESLNEARRQVEAEVLEAAIAQAEARGPGGPLVWAAGEGWHPGVVGIVAGRLKERFDRPAIAIGILNGEGKGSGRSVPGVDLGADVARLAREGLLIAGGGHKMAAGLTIAADRLEEAMAALGDRLAAQGAGAGGPADLRLDGALSPGAATLELLEQLEDAGPWGSGAPAPRFAIPAAKISFIKRAGERHLRLSLSEGAARLDAIGFNIADTPMGDMLERAAGRPVHVAGKLQIDEWGGRRKPKLMIDDAAMAE